LQVRAALLACLFALHAAAGVSADTPMLTVRDAWIRATPGVDVAAVYLTLQNDGSQPVILTGARSSAAAMAMIHESALVNGQSTMRARDSIRIGAGETVQFAPGGLHIMLHGLTHPLVPGNDVPLVLLLQGGGTLRVSAHVRPLGAP
jgi:periplasmic copper chaperone A